MTREEFARQIAARLRTNQDALRAYWTASAPVRHFYLDDLLPDDWAQDCFNALPGAETLMLRSSIKEHKHVGIDLEKYQPVIADMLFAFQHPEVLQVLSDITGISGLHADESLYGSGLSIMLKDDFLLPHLDNSHDGDGEQYRVLNALYYVSPGWPSDQGGNLELWDTAMKQRREIHARFNRLVMMETNTHSVHSVNKVTHDGVRACISNYYFSQRPADSHEYVHKTTFYARPEDGILRKWRLSVEGRLKNFLSKYFTNKATGTKHRRY